MEVERRDGVERSVEVGLGRGIGILPPDVGAVSVGADDAGDDAFKGLGFALDIGPGLEKNLANQVGAVEEPVQG